jgi:hypothetical protein
MGLELTTSKGLRLTASNDTIVPHVPALLSLTRSALPGAHTKGPTPWTPGCPVSG